MFKIAINECVYYVHPVYDLYASDKNGNVINIVKKVPIKGTQNNSGYLYVGVRKYCGKRTTMSSHRFIWECFNGVIPEGKVIDHINDDKKDNRLCNLQMLTQQQNCKKSANNRDYSFAAKNNENRKCVRATNVTTNEVLYFYSLYAVQQHLQINAGIVKMVCEGLNNCKSGVSKMDGQNYKFEYIKQDELPDNYHKSANKRPRRVSDEEKKKHQMQWLQKEYKCPRCDKTLTNGSKYYHNKKCL